MSTPRRSPPPPVAAAPGSASTSRPSATSTAGSPRWGRRRPLLELSLELSRSPAAAAAPLPPGSPTIDYRAQALAAAQSLGLAARPVFVWLRSDLTGRSDLAMAALRRATVLLGLLQEQPRDDLRTHHGATAGLLHDLAAALLRPLLATVALAREHGRPAAEVELLGRAARRLDPGPRRTRRPGLTGRPSHSSPPSHPGHPGHPGHAGHAGRDQPRRPPHAPSQPSRPAAVDPAGRHRSPRPATRQICLFAEA